MAESGSIATALAAAVAGIVYPAGTSPATGPATTAGGGGSTGDMADANAVTGNRTIIKRGWPDNAHLTGSCGVKSAGVDLVSVTTVEGGYRHLSEPLGWPWTFVSTQRPSVSVTVAGTTASIAISAGATPAGIVGLALRTRDGATMQDHLALSYAVQPQDTPQTIAAALAAQVAGASASGAQVSFPQARLITPVVSGVVTMRQVTRRQSQEFLVSVWSADWHRRDALGAAIDQGMAALNWLNDADGTMAQILGHGAHDNDGAQNSGLYRRDLKYRVIFDSTRTQTGSPMMFGLGALDVQAEETDTQQSFGQVAAADVVVTGSG